MTACDYVNYEANNVSTTGCSTIAFTGQPLPGLITGTATNTSSTTPFIAMAGQVNGKYVFVVLSQSTGGGVNFVAMQH